MGGEFFTDFKSLNGIEISWLVQAFSNFYWFQESTPLGGGRWVDGVRVGMGVWGEVPCTNACTHMHMHTHTHTHMHVEHDKHAKHGCLHVSSHLQFLYMYTCVCMCVCACTCMCVHVGTPSMPPDTPPTHLPPPQSHREPKTPKFNKSWTNWDNSILFEDSLPLNTPELI